MDVYDPESVGMDSERLERIAPDHGGVRQG